MPAPKPTLVDRLEARSKALDSTLNGALCCAIPRSIGTTDPIPRELVIAHLRRFQAELNFLQADIATLVALARAGANPAPSESDHAP